MNQYKQNKQTVQYKLVITESDDATSGEETCRDWSAAYDRTQALLLAGGVARIRIYSRLEGEDWQLERTFEEE